MHLVLVACVSMKRADPDPCPAQDLYCSPWFKAARAVAERDGDAWAILSAKHGLVDPHTLIAPYNQTLAALHPILRTQWHTRVWEALAPRVTREDTVTILAGLSYSEVIAWHLRCAGVVIHRPLYGLGLGQQLRLLNIAKATPGFFAHPPP